MLISHDIFAAASAAIIAVVDGWFYEVNFFYLHYFVKNFILIAEEEQRKRDRDWVRIQMRSVCEKS